MIGSSSSLVTFVAWSFASQTIASVSAISKLLLTLQMPTSRRVEGNFTEHHQGSRQAVTIEGQGVSVQFPPITIGALVLDWASIG